MIKKIIITILLMLPQVLQAQVAVGGWTMHSSFTGVDDIGETLDYVYYQSGNNLFRIDK